VWHCLNVGPSQRSIALRSEPRTLFACVTALSVSCASCSTALIVVRLSICLFVSLFLCVFVSVVRRILPFHRAFSRLRFFRSTRINFWHSHTARLSPFTTESFHRRQLLRVCTLRTLIFWCPSRPISLHVAAFLKTLKVNVLSRRPWV